MGRNIELYVDDILIKSKNDDIFLGDIEVTLKQFHQTSMKIQKSVCLGAQKDKFLGYIITPGIEVNLEKVEALLKAGTPRTVKDIQSLNGKLARLGRFLTKLTEYTLTFFQILKTHIGKKDITW